MNVLSLYLSDFRNYEDQKITLAPGLNVLYGYNAMGKTNLLEAVCMFGIGRSLRVTKDKELIRWDAQSAYISAETQKKFAKHKVEIMIDRQDKKRIAIDRMPIGKIGELMGALSVVLFSPDEMKLVKEAPDKRRHFIDVSLSQQNKAYYYTLLRYNTILNQRNKLLKETKNLDTLAVWDTQLAEVGAKIVEFRYAFSDLLKKYAPKIHAKLTDGGETLDVGYESQCENGENIKENLLRLLRENLEKDMRLTFTSVGPHRDDLRLSVNGIDVRKYGSQGQQRTVALALKLAELELFFENTGEYPVLLLDDVLSELDDKRQNALFDSIKHVQTIITCTEFPYKMPGAKIFEVQNGKIISERVEE